MEFWTGIVLLGLLAFVGHLQSALNQGEQNYSNSLMYYWPLPILPIIINLNGIISIAFLVSCLLCAISVFLVASTEDALKKAFTTEKHMRSTSVFGYILALLFGTWLLTLCIDLAGRGSPFN